MSTCKLCGKRGLFLKVSKNELCASCEVQLQMDLQNCGRIMNESIALIDNSKYFKTKLSRCDDFMRQVSILSKYEDKGIAATEPAPSELALRVQARKEEITREQANVTAVCPYCAISLQRTPKRCTACPSCSRPICVRKGKLCTEDEGRALDWCSKLGMDESEMYLIQKNLSEQFGRAASYADAVWQLMNRSIEKTKDYQERSQIYFLMARFLWEEKKDYLPVAQQGICAGIAKYKEDIKSGLLDPSDWDIAIFGGGSCPACSPWNGRRFAFEEFERIMPLPIAECTHEKTADNPHGWCRCSFGLVRKDGKGIFEQLRKSSTPNS
jgi:hypothetical protein